MDYFVKDAELKAEFDRVDVVKDGILEPRELAQAFNSAARGQFEMSTVVKDAELKAEFDRVDVHKDGILEPRELAAACNAAARGIFQVSEEQVSSYMMQYDTNKDGKLNFREFCAMMRHWEKDLQKK